MQAGTITIIQPPESCVTNMEVHSPFYAVRKQTLKTTIYRRSYAENSKAGKELVHKGTEWMKRSFFIKSLEPSTMPVLIYHASTYLQLHVVPLLYWQQSSMERERQGLNISLQHEAGPAAWHTSHLCKQPVLSLSHPRWHFRGR